MSLRGAGSGSSRYIRNSGVMITCWGSRLPAVKIIRKSRLNRQLKRDRTNAAIEASSRVRKTAGTTTISVFRKYDGSCPVGEGLDVVVEVVRHRPPMRTRARAVSAYGRSDV